IRDLLQYSRVGTSTEGFENLNLNEVMENVLTVLEPTLQETHAIVNSTKLPSLIYGNKTQLTQLFQNLIANAIKYRDENQQPKVEIGCKEKEQEWLFWVKDNGIGIEPKHFEKIFIIFQRLHSKQEFSGTGIGLAICKKIVERHQGKIWVESEPMKGSTFFFTLNKNVNGERNSNIVS
ncbi:MAG TPA: ATP-binding protein, partial [Flavisolibacter sp.]|nr:ATP-binding protein [Flavisolibacter sp.]